MDGMIGRKKTLAEGLDEIKPHGNGERRGRESGRRSGENERRGGEGKKEKKRNK